MSTAPLVVPPRGRALLGNAGALAGAGVTVLALTLLGGTAGFAAGLVTVGLLALFGPLVAVAGGVLALLGVGDASGVGPAIGGVLVTLPIVAGAAAAEEGRKLAALIVLVAAAVLGAFLIAGATLDPNRPTAVALVLCLLGLAAYFLHRYEQLTLGLLDDE